MIEVKERCIYCKKEQTLKLNDKQRLIFGIFCNVECRDKMKEKADEIFKNNNIKWCSVKESNL